MYLGVPIFVGG